MSDNQYYAENLNDYIDNLCEDLRNAIHDLDDKRDDESYQRLTEIRLQIGQLADSIIGRSDNPNLHNDGQS